MGNTCAKTDHRLLQLHERDNVLVLTQGIAAGEVILVEGVPVTLPADLPLGHKIARTAIEKAAKVIKYAAPIGSATYDISVGQHVHVHNVQSDYTPTYHLAESQARYGEAS